MGFERLREKYGNGATGRSVVNRAICDETPGGAKVLDLSRMFRQRQKTGERDAFIDNAYQILLDANQEMADAVLGKEWRK